MTTGQDTVGAGIETMTIAVMIDIGIVTHIADVIEIDIHIGAIKILVNNRLFHASVTTQGALA